MNWRRTDINSLFTKFGGRKEAINEVIKNRQLPKDEEKEKRRGKYIRNQKYEPDNISWFDSC